MSRIRFATALLAGTICVVPRAAGQDSVAIENDVLRVRVWRDTGALEVLDKRVNYTYRQASGSVHGALTYDESLQAGQRPLETGEGVPGRQLGAPGGSRANATPPLARRESGPLAVAGVDKTGSQRIEVRLSGRDLGVLAVELRPDEPATVFCRLNRADGAEQGPSDPGYPYPFLMDKDTGYLMQSTQGDGVLLPLAQLDRAKGSPFSFGNALPIYGVTDLRKGCVGVLESWRHKFVRADNAEYPMLIRYHFVTEGGYVALARYYREVVRQRGDLVTLRQKAEVTPQLLDYAGGPVIYLWGNARTFEFARGLKESGIERALIMMNLRTNVWPDKAMIERTRSLGYVVGRYVVGNGTEQAPVQGRGNRGGTTPTPLGTAAVTPASGGRDVLDLIRRDLEARPFQSRFFDTFMPQHNGGKTEALGKVAFFRTVAKQFGQTAWTGEGYTPDWSFPGLTGVEGSMTLRTYVSGPMNNPGRTASGGADWTNRYVPFAMVGDVETDETFWEWEVNPIVRIPLIGLVYHDCLMTTWNWRNANHRFGRGWIDQDLMNILFGNKPIWCLAVGPWEQDETFRQKLVESYRRFAPVLAKVELEDMTDHRWLSADRRVAMTSYANGVRVAVNFKDEPFNHEGRTIAPKSFVMWEDK